jgi:hypothetical protein
VLAFGSGGLDMNNLKIQGRILMDTTSKQPVIPPLLAGVSNQDLLDLVAKAKADPVAANQALDLQKKVYDAFEKMVQGAFNIIDEDEIKPEKKGVKAVSVVMLTAEAKRRAENSKRKRELAQSVMIGAIMNMDNPDWDPLDPATHKKNDQNGLLALMQMDLSAGQGAAPSEAAVH